MANLNRVRRVLREPERGIALVMVLSMSAVLMILATVAVSYSISGLNKAKTDQDWNAAGAAAYAGIEEYQSRLAGDTAYFQYGNPLSAFSVGSAVSLPTGSQVNPAFGIGTAGAWAGVAGSTGLAKFRYEVDNSNYINTGVIRVRSTGRAGGVSGGATRTIIADLRQEGFIDFLYFTDYEIQDPAVSGVSTSTCMKYAWAGRPTSGTSNVCRELAFGTSDTVSGPLHSNDTIRACGSLFLGHVTTAYNPTSGSRYKAITSNGTSCGAATFTPTSDPSYSPVVGMPSTNSQMKKETRSDLPGSVPRPGCLYTGPTTIVYNADGTMTVRSPWTRATNVAGDPAITGTPASACGVIGSGYNGLATAGGATFAVPARNVIYVQNVPSVSTDPNYWASTARPTGISCTGTTTITCTGLAGSSGSGNGIGYPGTNEAAPAATSYGFRNGDVFVKGVLNGQETVASENYIYVVGNLTYKDPGADGDMLGLVGNNAVWVWNPTTSGGSSILTDSGRTIHAAILSVAHSFQVQNYSEGSDRGTLTLFGAIAQKYRGPVRTTTSSGSSGYAKDYSYDARFKTTAPPKFLSPVTTTYGVTTWMDTSAAMNFDGSAR